MTPDTCARYVPSFRGGERVPVGDGPLRASGGSAGDQDRWFAGLAEAARRAGIELGGAQVRGGVLTVEVRAPGDAPLRVDLHPRSPRDRYYLVTARFGLRFQGTARPTPQQERALAALVRAVGELEAAWPRTLALDARGGMAAGGPGSDPLFTVERAGSSTGEAVWTELLVRLTSRCNQACAFCSGPPPHADADAAHLRAWLERELPRHPGPTVTLTGGEPTLWRGLADVVRALVARPDVVETKVQTNAVPLADPGRVAELPVSARLTLFVSFHAGVPELYDRCTGTTGQFERAAAGIRNLLAVGHRVTINVVANRHNAAHLPNWPGAVHALFGAQERLRVHFSITMCPEHRPEAPDWIVRYSELSPLLQEAMSRARALGLACDPLLASSHASIPACLVPPEMRARGARSDGGEALPVQRAEETGAAGSSRPWVKAPACDGCGQTRWCLGLPHAYAERFGVGELAPIG